MAMAETISARRDDVARLCQAHGVRRLDVFGSATSDQFDPDTSDIDFIVEFGPAAQQQLFVRLFHLKQALEALFARPVDLVMAGACATRTSSKPPSHARAGVCTHANRSCLKTSATRRHSSSR